MSTSHRVAVAEASQVAEARRTGTTLATRLGFGEVEAGKLALVVTEAATNLVKHGRGGEIVLTPVEHGGVAGLDVLALDRGPGMANVAACLWDGYSTAGSPGNGLGAIMRLSGKSDVFSTPGRGTAVLARSWADGRTGPRANRWDVAGVCLPLRAEEACGDSWDAKATATGQVLAVVDGLGHGPQAAEASQAALRAFRGTTSNAPTEILAAMHLASRSTRGAAAAVAVISEESRLVRFAGIGNIAAAVVDGGASRHAVSMPGILGQEMRFNREFSYPWTPESLFVAHSDGISTRWNVAEYAGLSLRAAALIAGVLYRDFERGRDDATVVVARLEGQP